MNLQEFLNSNFFQTLVTFLVGLFAYIIYIKQKRDHKKDAATSILLEIQSTERSITRLKESVKTNRIEGDYSFVPLTGWYKYQHLFARDLDRDEWDVISDFYSKAQLLNDAVKYNNVAFANDVEQIRANKQRVLAEFAKESVLEAQTKNKPHSEKDSKSLEEGFNIKTKAFDQIYMSKQGEFAYYPSKPLNDIKMYLTDIGNISTTSVGQKLKKYAR